MEKYIHGTHSAMRVNKNTDAQKPVKVKAEKKQKQKADSVDKPCESCRGL